MATAISPHPDPATVRAWFAGDSAGDIDGRALVAALTALRADSDWRVQAIPGPALWDIALVHWPTRTRLAVRLAPVAGERWHPVAPDRLTHGLRGAGPTTTGSRGAGPTGSCGCVGSRGIAHMGYCL